MDRHLARPALHRTPPRTPLRTRSSAQSSSSTWATRAITVPQAYGKLRLWRKHRCGLARLGPVADARARHEHARLRVGRRRRQRLPAGRADPAVRRRPSAGSRSSPTTGARVTTGGTATHNLTMYRAPSGALVFGAGTVQWAWGLDDWNPTEQRRPTQHAAGDGKPARRHGRPAGDPHGGPGGRHRVDRHHASDVDDHRAPRDGRRRARGSRCPAPPRDGGGGQVAGIEVSTDSGTTWHPATGTTSWTYTWVAHGNPSTRDPDARHRRQRQHRDARRRRARSTSTARARCGAPTTRRPSIDSSDPTPVEVGRQVHARTTYGSDHRRSASTRRPPTPARTSAACGPRPASGSPRRRSSASRPPAGRP